MAGRRIPIIKALVSKGLADDETAAASLIDGGVVLVNGSVAHSGAHLVAPSDAVIVKHPDRFVSRGGEKLDFALNHFGVDVSSMNVLDAGASTGGFTDCLLQRGVGRVVAVDVGKSQMHQTIARDHRVVVCDETNIRDLENAAQSDNHALGSIFRTRFDAAVVDLSFISLRVVAKALVACVEAGGQIILLVKPQFEATRLEVDKGSGIIRDSEIHLRVVAEVGAAFASLGCIVRGVVDSPIKGAQGNTEFLMCLDIGTTDVTPND
jgi:23S rRNA (cytidine1920-2'-O)/16S rRNA (cytidine1409-2'-O)-methyltransferase